MRSCFQIFPKSCAVSPATFQRRNVYSSIVFTRPERCSIWTPMAFSARLSETISSAISPKKAIQQTVVLLFQNNKNPRFLFCFKCLVFWPPEYLSHFKYHPPLLHVLRAVHCDSSIPLVIGSHSSCDICGRTAPLFRPAII